MSKCYLSVVNKCREQKCDNSVFCNIHENLKNDRDTFISIVSVLLSNNIFSQNKEDKKKTLISFFDFATYNQKAAKNISEKFNDAFIKKLDELNEYPNLDIDIDKYNSIFFGDYDKIDNYNYNEYDEYCKKLTSKL
jgi:hypothetical protein